MPLNLRITCKLCKRGGLLEEFKNSCDEEGCKLEMARRRGRANKPEVINFPTKHKANCTCNRCLDADATTVQQQFDRELERAWEAHNKEVGVVLPDIKAVVMDSPVIGPYEERDVENARFVNCAIGIYGVITPKGRRRK